MALDWHKGRVYIPLEDLARFDVDPAAIAAGVLDRRWSRLMAFETARTREIFGQGRALPRRLPLRAARTAGSHRGGLRILERIERVDGDVFNRRPMLTKRDWAVLALRTFAPARHA